MPTPTSKEYAEALRAAADIVERFEVHGMVFPAVFVPWATQAMIDRCVAGGAVAMVDPNHIGAKFVLLGDAEVLVYRPKDAPEL